MSSAISTLPAEILLEIFANCSPDDISKICLVCKTWQPIVQSVLYRSARLQDSNVSRFFGTISKHPHLYPLVRTIESTRLSTLHLRMFQEFRASSNVLSLCLYGHEIDEEQRDVLIDAFPQLEVLSLSGSLSLNGLSSLAHLVSSFLNLKSLILDGDIYIESPDDSTYSDMPIALQSFRCHSDSHTLDTILRWMMSQSSATSIRDTHLSCHYIHGNPPASVAEFISRLPRLNSVLVDMDNRWSMSASVYSLHQRLTSEVGDPLPLTFAANTELKRIALGFFLVGPSPPEWAALPTTIFSSVSSILVETIVIKIWTIGPDPPGFDWVALGNVLSLPKFTGLRMVDIVWVDPATGFRGDIQAAIDEISSCETFAHLVAKDVLTVR